MNEPKVRSILAQLDPLVDEMRSILDEHYPTLGYSWKVVLDELRDLRARPFPPEDVESFSRSTLDRWGVGMGSLGDMFVTDRFEVVRDQVSELLSQLVDAAHEGEINTLAVRRHLTTLETVLLETHHRAEAARARELLDAGEMDCTAAARFAAELGTRKWTGAATARVPAIVGALKSELAPYVAEVSA